MGISKPVADRLSVIPNLIDQRKEQKKRTYPKVSVRLTEELNAALKEVVEETGARSPSQVMRRALVIYHTLLRQNKLGNIGGVQMKGGEFIPLFATEEDLDVSA